MGNKRALCNATCQNQAATVFTVCNTKKCKIRRSTLQLDKGNKYNKRGTTHPYQRHKTILPYQ